MVSDQAAESPVVGVSSPTFRIYDAESNGSEVWSEDLSSIDFNNETSGLDATDAQAAIDELSQQVIDLQAALDAKADHADLDALQSTVNNKKDCFPPHNGLHFHYIIRPQLLPNRSAGSRERGWNSTGSTGHDAVGDEIKHRPALTAQTLADGEHPFDKPAAIAGLGSEA